MFVIGIDFDNTIVDYDKLFYCVAYERGLVKEDAFINKKAIRDNIRNLPEGETKWRRLQTIVYGPRIGEAKLMNGVVGFLKQCHEKAAPVYIISHKTEFAGSDISGINLRIAALTWMKKNNLFNHRELGLTEKNVYFEETREGKINRVKYLNCTHFIDDLEETFIEKTFPVNVEKILLTREKTHCAQNNVKAFTEWKQIGRYLFNGRHC